MNKNDSAMQQVIQWNLIHAKTKRDVSERYSHDWFRVRNWIEDGTLVRTELKVKSDKSILETILAYLKGYLFDNHDVILLNNRAQELESFINEKKLVAIIDVDDITLYHFK